MSSFDDAFAQLVSNEGGYVNLKGDPGGRTMWGITEAVARSHGYVGAMPDLPIDTAKQIYKTDYWAMVHGDDLDPHLAFQLFDTIVNGGHPVQWLQQALGLTPDGAMGPATLAAAKSCDVIKTCILFNNSRLQYMTNLQLWPVVSKGWARRIMNNLTYCVKS